jgi:hypothetical protein
MMRDAVALLAALRLTRLVTRDWLGEWTVVQPAKAWAAKHDGVQNVHSLGMFAPEGTEMWRSKLVSGLDCPHCAGFWLTLGTLAVSRVNLPQPAAQLRDLLLKGLAGSYVVGHVSSRIDR